MKKMILVCIGSTLVLWSCSKPAKVEQSAVKQQTSVPATPAATEDLGPENADNPMDAAGAWHNYELQQLQEIPMDGTESLSDMIQMQRTWRQSQNLPQVDAEELATKVTFIINDVPNRFHHIADASHLSDAGKVYVEYLADLATNQSDIDFASFKSLMVGQENAIMNNNQLATAEKNRLLSMYSIARYSYFYHANPNPFTDFDPPPVNPEPAEMMYISRWMVRAIVDCVGYIIGSDVDVNTSPSQAHEHGLAAAAEASDRFDHGVAPFD